jgi:energy-coupling factor transporter ATP-binding protein EcfA2/energy-coupling factor transporter transmembrane protein EcfT
MIKLEHATVYSKESFPLLKDINCSLKQGSRTLIIGPTGSGKTTLLSAIAGLLPLESGTIEVNGQTLWHGKNANKAVISAMGIAFQYPERQLFATSVAKEFAYTLRPFRLSQQEQMERIQSAMQTMKLSKELLQESVFTLSDGMKRKIAIATSLAAWPEWLLLDEPTAGLDSQGVAPFINAIAAYHKQSGGSVIIASHDLDTFLPLVDQILILHHGKLIADITTAELWANPNLLIQAGIGLPTSMQIALSLKEEGIFLTDAALNPENMAQAVIDRLREPFYTAKKDTLIDEREPKKSVTETSIRDTIIQRPLENLGRLSDIHPIAKWLAYLAISTGILIQNRWEGTIVAAAITLFFVMIAGVPSRSLMRPTKPFLAFIVISCFLSGISLSLDADSWSSKVIFSIPSATRTGQQLIEFFFIMVLGILLAKTTSGALMRRGLEQGLAFMERFKIPVSVISFSASLIWRFVPMIYGEMERMSLIMRARGKSNRSMRLRELPIFLIPMILSLMKHAEDLSFSLEARGFKLNSLRKRKVPADWLPFYKWDYAAIAVGFILLAILVTVDVWL